MTSHTLNAEALEPCPFCGPTPAAPEVYRAHLGCVRVIHGPCGSSTGTRPKSDLEGEAKVIALWNRRAALTAPRRAPSEGEWRWVPKKLTMEMKFAAVTETPWRANVAEHAQEIYDAMLAAAPLPAPAQFQGEAARPCNPALRHDAQEKKASQMTLTLKPNCWYTRRDGQVVGPAGTPNANCRVIVGDREYWIGGKASIFFDSPFDLISEAEPPKQEPITAAEVDLWLDDKPPVDMVPVPRELVEEILGSGIEYDPPTKSYLVMQVERDTLISLRACLTGEKGK